MRTPAHACALLRSLGADISGGAKGLARGHAARSEVARPGWPGTGQRRVTAREFPPPSASPAAALLLVTRPRWLGRRERRAGAERTNAGRVPHVVTTRPAPPAPGARAGSAGASDALEAVSAELTSVDAAGAPLAEGGARRSTTSSSRGASRRSRRPASSAPLTHGPEAHAGARRRGRRGVGGPGVRRPARRARARLARMGIAVGPFGGSGERAAREPAALRQGGLNAAASTPSPRPRRRGHRRRGPRIPRAAASALAAPLPGRG